MSAMNPIHILVVDDHALFAAGVARLMTAEPGIELVGTCTAVPEALRLMQTTPIDVVLLDYDLGTDRALDVILAARTASFSGAFLIVTAGVSSQEALQLVEAGVAGIFHKQHAPEQLCEAVRTVASGGQYLESDYLKPLFQAVTSAREPAGERLTPRDAAILRSLFAGLPNKQIADRLGISETAVKASLQVLFRKTGVRTRSQLVMVALERFRDQLGNAGPGAT